MSERKLTYHWVIVIACFLMMMASIGIIINCFNLFSVALMNEFGFSAGSVQLIITIAILANLVGGALAGRVIARFGMRVTLPIYAAIMSAGFFLYSLSGSLTVFYILSIFVGFGASGVSLIPCGVLINNWFVDKKGLATGIAFTGSVVGGLIFVQLTKYIIAAYGWREAYAALGIIAAVILLPTTLMLVRETPEHKGMAPLGADSGLDASETEPKGITTKAYIKTASFWLMAASVFIIGFINLGLQNNISIYLTKAKGHTEELAANIFSVVMFVQIFGKILLGAIYDKKGIRFGALYCSIVYILAVAALMYSGNLVPAIMFGTLFGLVCAMTTVTPPYAVALVAGVRDYPTIYGLLSLFYGIGAAAGPVVAGKVFDSVGSYDPAWFVYGGLALVLVATTILAVKKGQKYSQMTY